MLVQLAAHRRQESQRQAQLLLHAPELSLELGHSALPRGDAALVCKYHDSEAISSEPSQL